MSINNHLIQVASEWQGHIDELLVLIAQLEGEDWLYRHNPEAYRGDFWDEELD